MLALTVSTQPSLEMNRDLTHSLRTVYHSFLDPTSVAHSCQALYVVPLSFHSALIDRTTRSSCLEPIVRSGTSECLFSSMSWASSSTSFTVHHCRWIMEYVFFLPIIPTLLTPVSNRKSGTYVRHLCCLGYCETIHVFAGAAWVKPHSQSCTWLSRPSGMASNPSIYPPFANGSS